MIRRLKIPVILATLMLYSIIFLSVSVSAATATIQPSSQDSYINEWSTDDNTGGNNYLLVKPNLGHVFRPLVQFDLPSIPPGSTVSSAALKLFYNHGTSNPTPAGRTYMAYRVTQSWTEMGVAWAYYDGTNSWATSGGDYTTNGGASSTVPSSYGWMTWDVTNIVKAWIESSAPNYGFLIKDGNEASYGAGEAIPQANLCSREWNGNENYKNPILEITYTSPVQATIESCDSSGTKKDAFQLSDEVYAAGTGYSAFTTYDVYVVEDVMWADGMIIPPRVLGTATTITSDAAGDVPATLLWSGPLTPGKYDIVVDINGDGLYFPEIDALDNSDIEVTAGFFVIPEVAIGSIMAAAAMFTALGLFAYKKKHTAKQ